MIELEESESVAKGILFGIVLGVFLGWSLKRASDAIRQDARDALLNTISDAIAHNELPLSTQSGERVSVGPAAYRLVGKDG